MYIIEDGGNSGIYELAGKKEEIDAFGLHITALAFGAVACNHLTTAEVIEFTTIMNDGSHLYNTIWSEVADTFDDLLVNAVTYRNARLEL